MAGEKGYNWDGANRRGSGVAGKVLFLDLGDAYLIIIHETIHLIWVLFCLGVLFYNEHGLKCKQS